MQRTIMTELIGISTRLIVMTERGRRTLLNTYSVDPAQIDLIAHGIPDAPIPHSMFLKSNSMLRTNRWRSRLDCSLLERGLSMHCVRSRRSSSKFLTLFILCWGQRIQP